MIGLSELGSIAAKITDFISSVIVQPLMLVELSFSPKPYIFRNYFTAFQTT